MKIYLIDNENDAKQIRQLLKLNAECAKLHWSKTIKNLPIEVLSSLETIETFVEKKVYEVCSAKTLAIPLNEDEEMEIMTLLRKMPELRPTLGVGVIMAGDESKALLNLLKNKEISEKLITAIASEKNVILF